MERMKNFRDIYESYVLAQKDFDHAAIDTSWSCERRAEF